MYYIFKWCDNDIKILKYTMTSNNNLFFLQRITWNPLEVDQSLCLLKGKTHVSSIRIIF